MLKRLCWIASLAVVWIGIVGVGRAQENTALTFFEPVQGVLNDQTATQEWTFAGQADQVISLLVVTIAGDLDPVLEVIGPDGATLAENDDLDSLVTDAGLEALTLPVEGAYTVRVSRYENTSGQYELVVTPGFARLVRKETFDEANSPWLVPDNNAISVTQGKLRLRVVPAGTEAIAMPSDGEPMQDLYLQLDARLFENPSYAEVGIIFRGQMTATGLQAYQLKVNSEGKWMAAFQDASGEYVLQSWTSNRALSASPWTLAVLAQGNRLAFYGNGVLLGTLTDSRLIQPGMIGVSVMTRPDQPDPAAVLFDNVLITTRLGTTYRGLPIALTSWNSPDPADIAAEIAASEQVTLGPARDLFVPTSSLTTIDLGMWYELIGPEQAVYSDFLLGASVAVATQGSNVGCGILYRWQDERNLDMAFVDTVGGVGLVQARDGQLTTNVYDQGDMVSDGPNRVLVIAQGEHVALYVNGALIMQETVTPGTGRIGVSLLNYEDTGTDCYFTDIWVWPVLPG